MVRANGVVVFSCFHSLSQSLILIVASIFVLTSIFLPSDRLYCVIMLIHFDNTDRISP